MHLPEVVFWHCPSPEEQAISIPMLKRLTSSTMGPRYLQSSCTTLQNTFGETVAWMVHLWSTVANAIISLYLLIIPGYPWVFGVRYSLLPSGARQDVAVLVLCTSYWVAGRCKAAACQQAKLLTLTMLQHLSVEWIRGWNSFHHSRNLLSLSKEAWIHLPGLLGPMSIPSHNFFPFWEGQLWVWMQDRVQ